MKLLIAILLATACSRPWVKPDHSADLDLDGLEELAAPEPSAWQVVPRDYFFMASMEILITMDVSLSLDIRHHNQEGICLAGGTDCGGEGNVVIRKLFGKYPSDASYHLIWVASSVLANGIYLGIPTKHRWIWGLAISSIELTVVTRNITLAGLSFRF